MRSIPYTLLALPAVSFQTNNGAASASCNLMQPLWQRAAELLDASATARCFYLDVFYSKAFEEEETYAFPAATIVYTPEWKVANTAIRCNLDKALESFDAGLAQENKGSWKFTLVREPLDRFVSGFSEISASAVINAHDGKDVCQGFGRSPFESEALNSPQRAKAFLQNLVTGDLEFGCWLFWHVFSQLGPFRHHLRDTASQEATHVGKIEDFDKQWALVAKTAGTTFPEFDDDCGAHELSSNKTFPPRKNMDKMVSFNEEQPAARALSMILQEDKATRVALVCSILLPDYVCFNYELPDGPEACVEAGFAASAREWEHTVSTLRDSLCTNV